MNIADLAFATTNRHASAVASDPLPGQEPTPEQLRSLPLWAQCYIDKLQDKVFGLENRASEAETDAAEKQERVSELNRRRL